MEGSSPSLFLLGAAEYIYIYIYIYTYIHTFYFAERLRRRCVMRGTQHEGMSPGGLKGVAQTKWKLGSIQCELQKTAST